MSGIKAFEAIERQLQEQQQSDADNDQASKAVSKPASKLASKAPRRRPGVLRNFDRMMTTVHDDGPKTQCNFRLNAFVHRQLGALCKQAGTTIDAVMSELAEQFVFKHSPDFCEKLQLQPESDEDNAS